jgi:hypothetical protein
LAFYAFPPAHWRKIGTTNIIERAFREVRRRTRPMSSFTNPASCDRIVFGVISHLNRSWEKKPLKEFTQNARRYRGKSQGARTVHECHDEGRVSVAGEHRRFDEGKASLGLFAVEASGWPSGWD